MEEADGASEQQAIEKYIQEYSLEDCLDEILNHVVTERPQNPYAAIARSIELKSTPEIMGVRMRSVFLRGLYAVRATVDTNAGSFDATMSYRQPMMEQKEYSAIESKLNEVLRGINPCELKQVDEIVASVDDIECAESMAISIACCHAIAKQKAKPLYEVIAELAGTKVDEMALPLPVLTIATRVVVCQPDHVQSLQIYATRATVLSTVLDKYHRLVHLLSQHEKVPKPLRYSLHGTVIVDAGSIDDLARVCPSLCCI